MRSCSLINAKTDENFDSTRDVALVCHRRDVSRPATAHHPRDTAKQRVMRRKVDRRSGHTVLCRYSSRAARDTKHWLRAKTNYNDLHSTQNSSPAASSSSQPSNVPCTVTRTAAVVLHTSLAVVDTDPPSVLPVPRIDCCLISFALSRGVPVCSPKSGGNSVSERAGERPHQEASG